MNEPTPDRKPKPGKTQPKKKDASDIKRAKLTSLMERLERIFNEEAIMKTGHANKDEVEALQELLIMRIKSNKLEGQAKSFLNYGVDGDYGPTTTRAVELIQKHYGIKVDGDVGGQTVRSLEQNRKAKDLGHNPDKEIKPTKKLKKRVDESMYAPQGMSYSPDPSNPDIVNTGTGRYANQRITVDESLLKYVYGIMMKARIVIQRLRRRQSGTFGSDTDQMRRIERAIDRVMGSDDIAARSVFQSLSMSAKSSHDTMPYTLTPDGDARLNKNITERLTELEQALVAGLRNRRNNQSISILMQKVPELEQLVQRGTLQALYQSI